MPGIVGLITKLPRTQSVDQLARMVESLRHESFYTTGAWVDEPSGLYVGWVARTGSFSDGMPLLSEQGDVALAFSGEEYPEPGTAQQLRARGHDFDVDGSSYLVHLYEDDPAFPAELNGRFHGLLADRNRGTVLLFNDRYGMHRLYYYESPDAFYFAAEAKAILAVRPELRRLDSRGLGEFVSCGAVLENRTLFEGIQVLPPASAWTFRNRSLAHKGAYFHPKDWEEQEPLDPERYYQELRTVFSRNLPRYFEGREPIGMSLTGGLDTRMILACRRPAPGSLPCYTFGSMFRENHDVRVARRVAEVCNQPHEVLTAGQEFLSQFPRYAERAIYLTDGCVEVGRSPDLYLNEKAREIAPVRMTGNYGGEILRAVRTFKPMDPGTGLYCQEFLRHVQMAAKTFAEVLHDHPVSFATFQQAPWYLYGVLALEQAQLCMRSPFLDNDFVRTVFRSQATSLRTNEVSLRLVGDGSPDLLRIPTDRGLGGEQGLFFGAISRTLREFSFRAEYAYDMGMPQWLARLDHALSPLRAERIFVGRHKPFHFRIWYRDALAAYIQGILLDERALSRPYIDRKGLEAMVRGHVKGIQNRTNEIHKVLTLELVHRLFLDNPERGDAGENHGDPAGPSRVQFTVA
ncbi:MAG: asparagine synthase-related protein [Terracidiphilus sp.]